MTKPLRIGLMTALALGAFANTAQSDADGPDFFRIKGIASGKVLNIRDKAGLSGKKVGSIPADADGISNLGCQGGLSFAEWQSASDAERKRAQRSRWCRVRYEGTEGWVVGRFLAEGSMPTQQVLDKKAEPTQQVVGQQADSKPGTRWRLVGSSAGPAIGNLWFSIWLNGDVRGNSGCNNFFASGSFGGGSFQLTSPIGSTRMSCPEDELNEQETVFLSALERAAKYDFNLRTGTLWIIDKDDETLLELQLTD